MPAFAANSGITYQGRILKPDSTPVSGTNVQFRIQLRTPGTNNCLMYEEIQAQNLSATRGNFSLTINDGSGTRTDSSGFGLDRVFANRGIFTFDPSTCSIGSTYSPNEADGRVLAVYFKDETMSAWEPMPAQNINYVPFAFESKQIAGFKINNLMRVEEADGTLTSISPLSNANYDALKLLVAGTSGLYEKAGRLGGSVISGSPAAGQVLSYDGTSWTGVDPIAGVQAFAKTALPTCGAGQFMKDNGSGLLTCATPSGTATGTVTSVATGAGLTGGPITTNGTIALASLGVGGTGFKVTYDTYGRVTAAVALVEADIPTITTAGKVSGSAITSGAIGGSTSINTVGSINTAGALTSGSFSTGNITATSITAPSGSFTTVAAKNVEVYETTNLYKVTLKVPTGASTSYDLTLPATAGASGKILGTTGAGVLAWVDPSSASQWTNGSAGAIYYNGGFVGVGTTAPPKMFSVSDNVAGASGIVNVRNLASNGASAISFEGASGGVLATIGYGNSGLGSAPNQVFFNAASGRSIVFQNANSPTMTIDPTGSVGVGVPAPLQKLDVAGAIRVGDSTACDGTTTGSIRYNGGNLQFCNGTWQTLGVSGAGITTLTGDVTSTGAPTATTTIAAGVVTTAKIANDAVTTAKIAPFSIDSSKVGGNALSFDRLQQINSGRLVGRGSAGVGTIQEVTLGTNLALTTAGVLNASFTDTFAALPCADGYVPYKASGAWTCALATSAGTVDAIVKRDSAGSFVAAGATFTNSVKLKDGTTGGEITLAAPTGFTSYGLTLPTTAGTTGYVLTTNGSGALSWTNPATASGASQWTTTGSDIYYSTGKVGIGTNTPTQALDVNGAISIGGKVVSSFNSGLAVPGYLNFGGAEITGSNPSGSSFITFVGAGKGATIGFDNLGVTNRLRFGGYDSATPAAQGISAQSVLTGTLNTAGADFSIDGSAGTGNGAGGNILFKTAAAGSSGSTQNARATAMTIASGGNVGIGTTAPGTRLEVYTTSTTDIPAKMSNGANNNTAYTTLALSRTRDGSSVPPTAGFGTGMSIYAETDIDTDIAEIGSFSAHWENAPTSTATRNSYVSIKNTTAGTSSEKLRITSAGNVGIGTTSPATGERLHVTGGAIVAGPQGTAANSAGEIRLRELAAGGTNYVGFRAPDGLTSDTIFTLPTGLGTNGQVLTTNASGVLSWTTPAAAAAGFVNGGNSFGAASSLGNSDNFDLAFKTNNSTRMTLAAGGNIGIGTGSPTKSLHVEGTTFIGQSGGNNGDPRLGIQSNPYDATGDYSTQFIYTIMNGGANNTGAMRGLQSNFLASRAGTVNSIRGIETRVDTTSDQGNTDSIFGVNSYIQTSSPNSTNNIYGMWSGVNHGGAGVVNNAYGIMASVNKTSTGTITNGYGVYIDTIAGTTNYGLYQASATNKNYFAGNVGIGTTGSTAKLEVAGPTRISTASGVALAFYEGASSRAEITPIYAGNSVIFGSSYGDLAIKSSGNQIWSSNNGSSIQMMLTGAGNVGIGTGSPTEKLTVNGNILATEFLYSSDRRLKKDITPIESSLAKVMRLNGVTYRWITPLNEEADREQMGVIAQDVEAVFPQAVTISKDGVKRVNYPMLVAPLVESVKELNREIASLKVRAEKAEARSSELEKQNQAFELRLRALEKTMRLAK